MEYRTLGGTGIQVSPLCLGAMNFGGEANPDTDECVGMVHRALEAGVNFIDTADVYNAGESEEIVGKALRGRRDDVVLATKFHNPMGRDPNRRGNSRRWIMQAVEESLRRLDTDWIDLYQVHRPDHRTDIDETLGALTDLVHQGKIRAFGTSTYLAHQIVDAQWTAERRGRERVRTEQPPYSIFVRHPERDVLPVCLDHGMGVLVWSPLNGGWLTGRYRRGESAPPGSRAAREQNDRRAIRWDESRPEVQRKYELVERLLKLADEAGMSLVHLAQAWPLEHPAVTSAIIGPRTPDQLEDLLAGADVTLDEGLLDEIDRLVPPGTSVDHLDAAERIFDLSRRRRRRTPVTR